MDLGGDRGYDSVFAAFAVKLAGSLRTVKDADLAEVRRLRDPLAVARRARHVLTHPPTEPPPVIWDTGPLADMPAVTQLDWTLIELRSAYPDAWRLFGPDVLRAAATQTSACRHCRARAAARVHQRPAHRLTPETRELLGEPCGDCRSYEARLAGRTVRGVRYKDAATAIMIDRKVRAAKEAAEHAHVGRGLATDIARHGVLVAAARHGLSPDVARRYVERARRAGLPPAVEGRPAARRARETAPAANHPSVRPRSSAGRSGRVDALNPPPRRLR